MPRPGRRLADSYDRILVFLARHGPASVADMCGELQLTGVTIRHHLSEMRRDGALAEPVPRRRGGRGRPVLVYSLTRQAHALLPENLGELAVGLLEAAGDQLSPAALESLLAEAGGRIGRLRSRRASAGAGPRRRRAVRFLEQRGYLPSLTASAGITRLELAHCPYRSAAPACPAICAFDRGLVQSLFRAEAVLTDRILDLAPSCVFELHPAEFDNPT